MRYTPSTGLFDVSCSAAWELGRLLALASKSVSVSLYKWKRTVTQHWLKQRHRGFHDHPLGDTGRSSELPPPPDEVLGWFSGLGLLEQIPFNYLVPDEALLPMESIRFFRVDSLWMECLFDGAFSIGRVIGQDLEVEKQLEHRFFRYRYSTTGLSGVLIRSELVAGWPGLHVDAHDSAASQTGKPPLRRELYSSNVLCCLFEGDLKAVDIYLKPETLHFGLDASMKKAGEFARKLRAADGSSVGNNDKTIDPVPRRENAGRVIDIAGLSVKLKEAQNLNRSLTSDMFALEMIEGSVKVRFTPAPEVSS
ncbi:hypothetical protein FHR94_002608 [Halomonas cerina]|uniref:Uncharacterized protein n=1 Tax=Halomonas cerina TaxID=447424 RepID=A0A839VD90_9GAMM|nr:hypothetical protein [Halomonas cerina]MBB3191349.1 hypothetical protein [Halomonas cerina]